MNKIPPLRTWANYMKHIPRIIGWGVVGIIVLITLVTRPQVLVEIAAAIVFVIVLFLLVIRFPLGMGIFIMVLPLWLAGEFLLIRFTGIQTTRTVVNVSIGGRRSSTSVRIEFTNNRGARQTFNDFPRLARLYSVGQELTIAYRPGHGQDSNTFFDAVVVRPLLPDDIPLVIIITFTMLIAYGLLVVGRRKRRAQAQQPVA
jgi:hypothetical protein